MGKEKGGGNNSDGSENLDMGGVMAVGSEQVIYL